MSLALVLAATVLLVVGLLREDALALVYLSMACSAGAAGIIVVAARRGAPEPDADPDVRSG